MNSSLGELARTCAVFALTTSLVAPSGALVVTQPTHPATRTWLKGSWVLIGAVAPATHLLVTPDGLAASGDAVYTFDLETQTLKAFDNSGRLRWQFGGRGEREGEFTNGRDPTVDAQGRIWVSDARSSRVTVISPSGKLDRVIEVPAPLYTAVPQAHGTFWGLPLGSTLPVLFDSTGRRIKNLALKSSWTGLNFLVTEPRMCAISEDQSVMAFRWSDRFLVLSHSGQKVRQYHGIQLQDFPRLTERAITVGGHKGTATKVDSAAPVVVRSVTADLNRIYVLAGTIAPYPGRIVDTYDVGSGRYVGSYLLPEEVFMIALQGRNLAGLVRWPYAPAIRIWQWIPATNRVKS